MDNMIVVALMVVGLIVINPFLRANEAKKVAAQAAQPADETDQDETEEDVITMDDEEDN